MRTDKIRKYLIPNIPYLFILWAFLKLGTAYRLAAGNDFAHKLIGLGQTIGPAFADFAPGLAPLDWLVGIAVSYTHLAFPSHFGTRQNQAALRLHPLSGRCYSAQYHDAEFRHGVPPVSYTHLFR